MSKNFSPRWAWKFVGSGDDQLFKEVDYLIKLLIKT